MEVQRIEVLKVIPIHLQEESSGQEIPSPLDFHRLEIHWDSSEDKFYVAIAVLKPTRGLTKQYLMTGMVYSIGSLHEDSDAITVGNPNWMG